MLIASSPPPSLFCGHQSKRRILQGRICKKALMKTTVGRHYSWRIWTDKMQGQQQLASSSLSTCCSSHHPDCRQKFPPGVYNIHVAILSFRSSTFRGRSTSAVSTVPNRLLTASSKRHVWTLSGRKIPHCQHKDSGDEDTYNGSSH